MLDRKASEVCQQL